jgi:hypothetical protein
MRIGITERGDAGLDHMWLEKLSSGVVDYAILITKDPDKLVGLQYLNNIIIHCTITNLGTDWEPNVPDTRASLKAYESLVGLYGGDKVVLRVDPVIPVEPYLVLADYVIRRRLGRVRISFMDMYPHVRTRHMKEFGRPFDLWTGLHAPLTTRKEALRLLERSGPIEVCGEPDIPCTGCVSKLDLDALGLETSIKYPLKGQRKYCSCLAVKTELLGNRHPCAHGCLYCYWKD